MLAKKELGDKFDIRAFHDELLGNGALPLDIPERGRSRTGWRGQKGAKNQCLSGTPVWSRRDRREHDPVIVFRPGRRASINECSAIGNGDFA